MATYKWWDGFYFICAMGCMHHYSLRVQAEAFMAGPIGGGIGGAWGRWARASVTHPASCPATPAVVVVHRVRVMGAGLPGEDSPEGSPAAARSVVPASPAVSPAVQSASRLLRFPLRERQRRRRREVPAPANGAGWSKVRLGCDDGPSRAPDASHVSAPSRGPLYFAWGCFRDSGSGPCDVPPAPPPGKLDHQCFPQTAIDSTPPIPL